MNSDELYKEIKKSNIFTNFYKTKALFQSIKFEQLMDSSGELEEYEKIIGFFNHGQKYELVEKGYIANFKNITFEYEFNKVNDFRMYEKNSDVNFIEINKEIHSVDNIDDEFKAVFALDKLDAYDILPNDIIVSDFIVLSKGRNIDGHYCEGFMDTFSGKVISLEQYQSKFLKKETLEDIISKCIVTDPKNDFYKVNIDYDR